MFMNIWLTNFHINVQIDNQENKKVDKHIQVNLQFMTYDLQRRIITITVMNKHYHEENVLNETFQKQQNYFQKTQYSK